MTTLVVRNNADYDRAAEALRGPLAETIKDVRCEGWPRLTLTTDEPLDVVRCSSCITDMQELVMRLVCGIKYGTDDLRYLKAADKAAVHLGVGHAPAMRGISIDFSGAANAALQSAKDVTSRRQSKGRMASLFEWLRGASGTPAETWKGVGLQIGLAAVDKCTPGQITATLNMIDHERGQSAYWTDELNECISISRERGFPNSNCDLSRSTLAKHQSKLNAAKEALKACTAQS